MKQAESLPQAPEDLMRFCDQELQRMRSQRKGGRQHRAAVLAGSLFILIIATMGAFFFLFARLQEMRPSHDSASPGPAVAGEMVVPPAR